METLSSAVRRIISHQTVVIGGINWHAGIIDFLVMVRWRATVSYWRLVVQSGVRWQNRVLLMRLIVVHRDFFRL